MSDTVTGKTAHSASDTLPPETFRVQLDSLVINSLPQNLEASKFHPTVGITLRDNVVRDKRPSTLPYTQGGNILLADTIFFVKATLPIDILCVEVSSSLLTLCVLPPLS